MKNILYIVIIVAAILISLFILNVHPSSTKKATTSTVTQTSFQSTSTISTIGKYTQSLCLDASENATAMRIAISNGITCFRADIALNQGEINFVSNASKSGAQYLGILDYATVGAQPSRYGCISGCNWTLSTWNASVSNAVLDYPWVKSWEIYNEPLISEFASGYENKSAFDYYNMIKSGYTIIKGVNPNATIVCFGGAQTFPFSVMQNEYAFYRQVWAYGAAKYCDAISLHSYILPYYNLNQSLAGNATIEEELNYTLNLYENLTGKPVWITETGLPSNSNYTLGLNFTEQEQASFLNQDMNFFTSYPFVKRIYWFHLDGYASRGLDYGLLNASTLQPKPSWRAFLCFLHNSTC